MVDGWLVCSSKLKAMKKLTILLVLVLGSMTVFGQDFKSIVTSIEKGDIATIEPMLEDMIDYCFNDDQDLLEKPEFVSKLKSAINTIQPKSSEIIHVADSKGEAKYAVAKIVGASDAYRMFVYTEGDKIIEIRFNKE